MCALAAALSPATYGYYGWNCSDDTPTISICDWGGVYCNIFSYDIYIIILSNGNLHGALPTAIGLITSLRFLDLGENSFTGTIPTVLTQLEFLYQLNLSNNMLTGTIPLELGNLNYLYELDLDTNSLTGSVPEALCSNNLDVLYLYNNPLHCYATCLKFVHYFNAGSIPTCPASDQGNLEIDLLYIIYVALATTLPIIFPFSCT